MLFIKTIRIENVFNEFVIIVISIIKMCDYIYKYIIHGGINENIYYRFFTTPSFSS